MNLTDILLFAAATPVAPPPAIQGIQTMIFPVAMVVIFYFLLLRPQQKRTKDHQKLVASVQTGDSVVTSAGIHGVVTNVKEKTVLVRVADNVKLEFDRSSIVSLQRGSEKAA